MAEEDRGFTAASFYRYLTEERKLMGVRCLACGTAVCASYQQPPICGLIREIGAIRRTPHRVYPDQNGQAKLICPRFQHRRILKGRITS